MASGLDTPRGPRNLRRKAQRAGREEQINSQLRAYRREAGEVRVRYIGGHVRHGKSEIARALGMAGVVGRMCALGHGERAAHYARTRMDAAVAAALALEIVPRARGAILTAQRRAHARAMLA